MMQKIFNKINKTVNFLNEDSIDIINENQKKDKDKIDDKEKAIEDAVKNNFPFDIQKKENDTILKLKEEEEIGKKAVFKDKILRKKRGRQSNNKSNKKKEHSAKALDNVTRKIQTNFIQFIPCLLNDIGFAFENNKKPMFKKLKYSEIKSVNFKTVKKLKKLKIKELFSKFSISTRYKQASLKDAKNMNEQNLDKLCKYSGFKEFINQNFLKVFSLYYNKGKELKSILIGGKVIPISKKTKDFSCLLKNNKQIEKELIEVAELVYSNQNIFNVSLDIKEQK